MEHVLASFPVLEQGFSGMLAIYVWFVVWMMLLFGMSPCFHKDDQDASPVLAGEFARGS